MLAASRRQAGDQSQAEFSAYCSEKGFTPECAEAMYSYLQGLISVKGFPIQLSDELYQAGLQISRDDIDEIAEDLAAICRCKVRWDRNAEPINDPTVRDLINLIAEWRGAKVWIPYDDGDV